MTNQNFSPEPDPVHTINPGPVLILAGPGTGKTHSLALRIKWLVEEQSVSPDEITVITFTAEAALNLRRRLSDEEKPDVFMPRDKQPAQISTMHSLGLKIITNNLNELGLSSTFRVIDSDRLRRLVFEDAAQLVGMTRERGRHVSDLKQKSTQLDEKHELAPIARSYDAILRACNSIDFDDQIILACQLLSNNASLLADHQKRARHLLIDEYQDINLHQFDFIRLLTGTSADGLFAVGDDDQSIYSFRGGSPEYVRDFREHFGDKAKVRSMPHCRRCPPNVLKGALAIVTAHNPDRSPVKLDPTFENSIDTPIYIHDSPSQEKEAEIIAAICSKVTPSHDVLILVPHLNFAKPIVSALRRQRVSYDCRTVVQEDGFITLDILGDWLKDQTDSFALRQCMQFLLEGPQFGVPSSRVKKAEKKKERERLLSQVSSLWKLVIEKESSLYDAVKANAKTSSLLSNLIPSLDELVAAYGGPPDKFLEVIGRVVQPWNKPSEMFQEISTWIDEVRGRHGSGQTSVRIMTMRMAKGLEAEYVFVTGLDEGVFPRSTAKPEELEEASRLLFVSMTRAKVELHLCHARLRSAAITHLLNSFALKQSPFIKAIPKEFLKVSYIPAETVSSKGKRGVS